MWQLWQWHSPFLEISSSEQRLPQPVVREHKVARERGRAGERAWLHLPRRASKALKAWSGSPTRSSVQRLQRPRALAGCSKAHACCNLPPPMISCSFLKLLSGGIESSSLPCLRIPFIGQKFWIPQVPRDHLFCLQRESHKRAWLCVELILALVSLGSALQLITN